MTHNPYTAPQANVASTHAKEYGEIKIFSARGRIGRIRYIGYSIGLTTLIIALVLGIGGAIGGNAAGVMLIGGWVMIVVFALVLSIQRAHDFNATGWLSMLALISLVNIIFWFIPGTDGCRSAAALAKSTAHPLLIRCVEHHPHRHHR